MKPTSDWLLLVSGIVVAMTVVGCNHGNGNHDHDDLGGGGGNDLAGTSSGGEAVALMLGTASSTVRIGENFAVTVTAVDKNGAKVDGYRGTVKFTTDDPTPPPAMVTFTDADHGARMVAFSLSTVGTHKLTATDVANAAVTGSLTVQAQDGLKMIIAGVGAMTTTSSPFAFTVSVMSGTQVATDYRGTVHFSSSDAVAYLPAEYTFTAADNGKHDFKATLNSQGDQMLISTDTQVSALTAAASTNVAGPGYYYVDPSGGKIRLVHNADQSTPSVAVLDLIAVVDLTGYFVGFNLAVDAAKLNVGSDLITAGDALNPGSSPAALKALIPPSGPLANALVSGLSQKAAGTGAVMSDATIPAGKVFYTLKLPIKGGAAGGTVFDGTAAKAKIRAGLRNKVGSEVVGINDFAIGKLVYKP